MAAPATRACPACKNAILGDDDAACCHACRQLHRPLALTRGILLGKNVDLGTPPAGAWYRTDGMMRVAGATNRSIGAAIGLLAISLFWIDVVQHAPRQPFVADVRFPMQ